VNPIALITAISWRALGGGRDPIFETYRMLVEDNPFRGNWLPEREGEPSVSREVFPKENGGDCLRNLVLP
jgi:hypothetical protein